MVQRNFDSTNELYHSRKSFYKRYGNSFFGSHGYGNAELAFLRWLIRRGVLGPCETESTKNWHGSQWWYKVHKDYTWISEEAAKVFENKSSVEFKKSEKRLVDFWIAYFHIPSPQNWYQAHNASVVYAYIKNKELAKLENKFEQFLINVVLYRMLIAQYIIINNENSSRWFIRLCAHPTLPLIKNLLKIEAAYPAIYPLDEKYGTSFIEREQKYNSFTSINKNIHSRKIMAKIKKTVHTLYYICPATLIQFLGPEIDSLYKMMSNKLEIDELKKFQLNGTAIYPYIST
ncbi:MAG: hypothetical protein AB8G05_22620 [Oligoflexales bacterium]